MKALQELCMSIAPSGYEWNLSDRLMERIKDMGCDVNRDVQGNLTVHKPGKGKRMMICAHMDEVGIAASMVDGSGFVRYSKLGDFPEQQGAMVQFINGAVASIQKEHRGDKMFCDTMEADAVEVGDAAGFFPIYRQSSNFIMTKAPDSRVPIWCLLNLLKEDIKSQYDLYVVFAVGDKLGQRGMTVVARNIKPDMCIVLTGAQANDIPENRTPAIRLGKGPAIKVMDKSGIAHQRVTRLIQKNAAESRVAVQMEVTNHGKSALDAVATSGVGVMCGGIAIPIRYNGPYGAVNIHDVKNMLTLTKNTIG